MPVPGLTTRRILNSKPKKKPYTILDRNPKGLSMRVSHKGRKTFIVDIMRKGVRHRETIGTADDLTLKEARAKARARINALTAIHQVGPDTLFEDMAEITMMRMERLWRPRTMLVNQSALRASILPFFRGRTIAAITHLDVAEWYSGLQLKASTANRVSKLLSLIMREAENAGARPEESNPVQGLQRRRESNRGRVLTPEEMGRLGAALRERRADYPMQVAMVTMIALTGCRTGEMKYLQWRDYRDGHLHLPDSKTGPKMIVLSSHARAVLANVKSPKRGLVFRPPKGNKAGCRIEAFWKIICRDIGLTDVRLHDLRHTYASIAIRSGESLVVIGKLLGHRKPDTTLGYAQLDDSMMRDAVDRISSKTGANREKGEAP